MTRKPVYEGDGHTERLRIRFCRCGRELARDGSFSRDDDDDPDGDVVTLYSDGRRSSLDFYMDILEVISRGIEKPTNIMSASNTNWPRLQNALVLLLNRGLLNANSLMGRETYSVTDDGYRILALYMDVRKRLELL